MSLARMAHLPVRRLLIVLFALAWLASLPATATRAVELPPDTIETFLQTNGPDTALDQGDWYTSKANGVGAGYHYVTLNVPCGWPSDKPVMIDLFSPEMNANNERADEFDTTVKAGSNTVFELYPVGTKTSEKGQQPNQPAPGTGIAGSLKTYPPVGYGQPKPLPPSIWQRFYTLAAPVQCGAYVLRAESQKADQNSWKLRIGTDNDNDPTNPPPANYDNPDGVAGTGDELLIGVAQASYQHEVKQVGPDQCLTLYQYVDPGLKEVFFHNFDMDKSALPQSVRYYAPHEQIVSTGGITGTVSNSTVWDDRPRNSPNVTRGVGDRVANPVGGWWAIVTCASSHNQYIQEAQAGQPTFLVHPPTPVLAVSKDDGLTTTAPDAQQTYTIAFKNTSDQTTTPGAAQNVTLTDALPSNVTFVSCAITAPFTGTCAQNGGQVVYQLNGLLVAGASGTVTLTVKVNADATGTVANTVQIDGQDTLGNKLPPANDDDIDQIESADLSLTKVVDKQTAKVGDQVIFSIVVHNDGPSTATNVQVLDQWPSGLAYVANTSSQGVYDPPSGLWLVGTIANGANATLTITATVLPGGSYTNTAQISHSDQYDRDSTPNNNNPLEDDQAKAGPLVPSGATAVTLERFTATRAASGVQVNWSTSIELNTWSFQLLRSADSDRAHAVRVTSAPISAQGRGGSGASYSWTDTSAQPGTSYSYWLQESELNGVTNEYGPATTAAPAALTPRVMVPIAR